MLKDIMLSENKPDTKDVYHTCFNSHIESKVIDVIEIDTGLWFPGARWIGNMKTLVTSTVKYKE